MQLVCLFFSSFHLLAECNYLCGFSSWIAYSVHVERILSILDSHKCNSSPKLDSWVSDMDLHTFYVLLWQL